MLMPQRRRMRCAPTRSRAFARGASSPSASTSFLVSLLVAAIWIVSIVLTLGLALFFLPPLWPIVAFFLQRAHRLGPQHGDARHAGDGSRNAHAGHRRAGPVHQCGRSGRAVLCELVSSRRSCWCR